MNDRPEPGAAARGLAGLLSEEPRAGWRGALLRLGRVRGVVLITAVSVLLSLAVTATVGAAAGRLDRLAVDLLVASLVPLIVAPLVSGAALGLLAEVEAARAALREVAVRDGLTGLYNRRFFAARLEAEIQRTRRHPAPLSVALVLVDVDHFKRINDTRGHAVGDEVLHRVAQALQAQVRPYDIAARFGGEEFVLMLPGSSAGEGAAVAERVRQAVEALQLPCLGEGAPPQVTVSLGVAALQAAPDDADALLRRADAALYQAKRDGRNRSVTQGDGPAPATPPLQRLGGGVAAPRSL